MLHRNDITYSPRSAAQCQCEYPSPIRPVGRGQSLQLPAFASPSLRRIPSTPLLLCPATVSLSAVLVHSNSWRRPPGGAACVKRRAAHFGKIVWACPGGVRGQRFEVRGAERVQTTCNNFVQKFFPSLLARQRHNLGFLLLFYFFFGCLRTFWHYFSATAARTHSGHAPAAALAIPHANKFKYALCARRLNKFASSFRAG